MKNFWCPLARIMCLSGSIAKGNYGSSEQCAFWHEDKCLYVENLKKNVLGIRYNSSEEK